MTAIRYMSIWLISNFLDYPHKHVMMNLNQDYGRKFVYIHDSLSFSCTVSERKLKKVLQQMIEVGLSRFIRKEVHFLSHIITPQGIKTGQHQTTTILEFSVPQNSLAVHGAHVLLYAIHMNRVPSLPNLCTPSHRRGRLTV